MQHVLAGGIGAALTLPSGQGARFERVSLNEPSVDVCPHCGKRTVWEHFAIMKNPFNKINRSKPNLGDLVAVVASSAQSERETLAALLDLFASGRVKIKHRGHLKRVRLSV